jgi:hypothetical protein
MGSQNNIRYTIDDRTLTVDEFGTLFSRVWRRDFQRCRLKDAIERTINVTARDGTLLVGCVRILSDGYLVSTVAEVLVEPEYRELGISYEMLELAWRAAPTDLVFDVQSASPLRMQELGWQQGPACYYKRKAGEGELPHQHPF